VASRFPGMEHSPRQQPPNGTGELLLDVYRFAFQEDACFVPLTQKICRRHFEFSKGYGFY